MERLVWSMHSVLHNKKQKTIALRVGAGFLVVAFAIIGAAVATSRPAEAAITRDCDANAIMECGAATTKEFAEKYTKNAPKDLDNIFASYGLNKSEMTRFQKNAKLGSVTKNGDVLLNGKVIATDAKSLGRHNISGSTPKKINGETYYERPTSISFSDGTSAIPAFILMNGDKIEFIALTSCGNPVTATPKPQPKPDYKCETLHKTAVKGKKDSYEFYSTIKTENGAKLSKVVYNFGDGTDTVTKAKGDTVVPHTFKKPGKFEVKVTAYFEVNGVSKSLSCTTTVQVAETPPATTTPTPTPPAANPPKTETPPTELPATGAEVVAAAFGITSLSGAAFYWLQSRKQLFSRLLGREQ